MRRGKSGEQERNHRRESRLGKSLEISEGEGPLLKFAAETHQKIAPAVARLQLLKKIRDGGEKEGCELTAEEKKTRESRERFLTAKERNKKKGCN